MHEAISSRSVLAAMSHLAHRVERVGLRHEDDVETSLLVVGNS